MKKIDTRGLSCPQPVILVSEAINEDKESFEVLIDSEASKENVLRILEKNNLIPKINEEGGFTIYEIER
ncbi:MAG: sulfurtransferase TusA family protein [Calditrichia bacterium]|nr:sulfurtransferase TusA family protein [Calditrichia bacterium]